VLDRAEPPEEPTAAGVWRSERRGARPRPVRGEPQGGEREQLRCAG
jgi:hypothetical protein